MFKDMKLRNKMILGYFSALLIVMIALGFGIRGLYRNVGSFEAFTMLAENTESARRIEASLLESRLAYKKYMTTSDEASVDQFDLAYSRMNDYVGILRSYASDYENESDYRTKLQRIEADMVTYKNKFEQTRELDVETKVVYDELAAMGYILLDELESLQLESYSSNEMTLNNYVDRSLQTLLRSRLHATKYFDFHTQQEYDDYLTHFIQFETSIDAAMMLSESSGYSDAFNVISDGVRTYKAGMVQLYKNVLKMDNIEADMDEIGPKIYAEVEALVEIIIEEQAFEQNKVQSINNQNVINMLGLTLLAIIYILVILFRILKLVVNPINAVTVAFNEIAEGDIDTGFRLAEGSKDEIGMMSTAFNQFMVKLSEMMEDISFQNLMKTGQNSIHDLTRDENELLHLSEELLRFIVEQVNGQVGRIYLQKEDSDNFEAMANYGLDLLEDSFVVRPMEGIIGNALITQKVSLMHNIPEGYMHVKTGLGEAKPSDILIIPCTYNDEVNCVIEIGHIAGFSMTDLQLLEGLAEVIGNVIHSTSLRHEMRILLEKTINQSEELQMQQEELRQSNEELEEQTRALKESEQRLQAQQEELRVSNEELEERSKQLEIQKNTLDEKNKAILESQDEILEKAYDLEQANRYKSEFLANMSHELRTPLNSILVLSQLLGSRDNTKLLTEKEREFANTIHTSGTDLLTLINGVLDLSKVEAGKLEMLTEEVPVAELVSEYERLFVPVAEVKSIEFKTHIESTVPRRIQTDRLRLSQVMKNLISNAIKFTHDGHVEVSVRPPSAFECEYTGLAEADHIAFEVRDTGIGIEPDKKDVIFEAFKQEDGTTSRTYGGTGLGLTISLELSKLLGGDIVLESEVGVGSQFVLIVPIAYDSANETTSKESAVARIVDVPEVKVDSMGEEETEPITVELPLAKDDAMSNQLLIIEDDQSFAGVLATLAEEKGYEAILAYNGREGLKLAKSVNPAAIILDMGLPDMDGMDVAKQLEKDQTTNEIPIHVISGREMNDTERMPKSIIGFLKKPVNIKSIYKTLAKIESLNDHGFKKLIVVGNCGGESFEHFTNLGQVEVVKVESGQVGIEAIKQDHFGCIVLDTKLDDMTGMEFISKAHEVLDYKIPIIIYTDEDINFDEYDDMNLYAESIILKSEKSRDRLTDEVTLFLHDMNKTIEQYEGSVSKNLRANVKMKIDEENSFVGKRVLLVDDDERNVFALLHALEQFGLEVIVAKDGYGAIDKFESEVKLDIVLMDIMMPKMDGYEAIRRIRDMEKGQHVPIIALTAKAMSEDKERCISAGANDYMTKPIDVEKLMSLMKVWMA